MSQTTFDNAIFRTSDPYSRQIYGYEIADDWWSRHYEYPWAFGFAEPGMVCADMGAGWNERPFKRMLAAHGCKVFAVDTEWYRADIAKEPQNGIEFVQADITKRIDAIQDHSIDIVYCISVLEDLGDMLEPAMVEFARCVKRGGLVVITHDVQYDMALPLGRYPGISPHKLMDAAHTAGLRARGTVDYRIPPDAVHNEDFNLCCFHCVLEARG